MGHRQDVAIVAPFFRCQSVMPSTIWRKDSAHPSVTHVVPVTPQPVEKRALAKRKSFFSGIAN